LGGGYPRNRIARLETDGRLDRNLDFNPFGNFVYATAVQPDGKSLIGGDYNEFSIFPQRNHIVRRNRDGTLDHTFNPTLNLGPDSVHSIAVQADGKILVGGIFSFISGTNRNGIARLDAFTGLPDSFDPNANGTVSSIMVQADEKILVGGDFTSIGGQIRNRIARLDPTTGLADSFNPNSSSSVRTIALQADGKVLAGGDFTNIGGASRNRIARLDATTGLADSFNPNANGLVYSIAVQADGNILAAGQFNGTTSIGGTNRNYIARLDAATGLADSFKPNPNGVVYSMAVQADGQILAGGQFTSIGGGEARTNIARLDPLTGFADSYNPHAEGVVYSIALQSDGKILVGGRFTLISGQTRLFARFSNNTVALQSLAVTNTAIIWNHSGSSPQFTRVTFEYSTNNLNYTPLGNGTAAASHWTLTGLNLATAQNLYIRARGYHRGGIWNGSESITESVRNVFLIPQPRLNIQRSANTNVVLSWATSATGFTLESKTDLNTNLWSVVSPAPVVSGTNNVVTNAVVSGSARFYRLRQ
jgi:uncharacterized delta-60 repeat protein